MRSFVVLALLTMASAGKADAANLVINGSFETGDFTGWDLALNTDRTYVTGIDFVAPTDGRYQAIHGPLTAGQFWQPITLVPFRSYRITADIAAGPGGLGLSLDVGNSIYGGSSIIVSTPLAMSGFSYRTFMAGLRALASDYFVRIGATHPACCFAIDNIVIEEVLPVEMTAPDAVPFIALFWSVLALRPGLHRFGRPGN